MRSLLPSILHRALGEHLTETDIDCMEYGWINNDVEFFSIIDYKDGEFIKNRKTTYQTGLVQRKLANKLSIPFFVVHYYLSNKFKIKMLFIIPGNNIAKSIAEKVGKNPDGFWLSLRNYSRFIHYLHKIPNDINAQKNLSNEYIEYPLSE